MGDYSTEEKRDDRWIRKIEKPKIEVTAPLTPVHSGNKYLRWIFPRHKNQQPCQIDVYSVLEAFDVCCPALQHCIKKLLCAGIRGQKDRMSDLKEAVDALERAVELEETRQNKGELDE